MKGREAKASSSTDLLVCFPSRVHLSLMPKPICSPGRPQEYPNNRHHNNHNHHPLKKSSTTRGQASPLIWTNTKSMGSEITEPTSPKVTCAGQIKVIRPKTTSCKSWQSAVMEEIEMIHNNNKQKKKKKKKKKKKRPSCVQALGFKKEVMMKLLTCLQSMRLDPRCLGNFPEGEDIDEDEDEGYGENHVVIEESDNETSRTVFSKWLMVLQENQSNEFHKEDTNDKDKVIKDDGSSVEAEEPNVPPPNALLLMRCRSAPVKSLLKENEKENNEEQEQEQNEHIEEGKVKEKAGVNKGNSLKSLMEENRKKENLVVMRYDSDFYKISSSDIAKDTWIVGELRDPLPKSRSCNK